MKLSSLRRSAFPRFIGFSSALATSLALAGNVLAQTSTTGTSTTTTTTATKGGTAAALPNAGSVELTFIVFGVGLILFVIGTIKLASSYRE